MDSSEMGKRRWLKLSAEEAKAVRSRGGKARKARLSKEQRKAIASQGGKARQAKRALAAASDPIQPDQPGDSDGT